MPTELAYADIHHLSNVREADIEDLRAIIQTYPLIDNHAHNLLREEEADGCPDYPFESITSEAQGHALQEHVHSTLAHIRGIRQLAELFDCPPSLADVKAARYEWAVRDYDSLIRRCLVGTHCLLIDDGLPQDSVYPVRYHDRYAPTVRRIARIEAIAAELLEQLAHAAGLLVPGVQDSDWPIEKSELFLQRFNTMFRNQIKQLASDPLVRGFKSVVCYRSGLDVALTSRFAIRPRQSLIGTTLLSSFHHFLRDAVAKHDYRVEEKVINDFLVVAACDTLSMLVTTEGETVPIQFHTGLGDVDIDLIKSNPAYLQPLIEAFPNVDFVVLHSAYPYSREAGFLAANFANCFLDIGEVFPMISRQGQESVLRQALELTPASKILWSTDGHFYPETFYLANRQFREVLETVLASLVLARDLSVMQAINTAVDILFWNSNTLYKLDEERKYPQLLRAVGRRDVHDSTDQSTRTTLVSTSYGSVSDAGLDSHTSTAVQSPATGRSSRSRALSTRSPHHTAVLRPTSDPFADSTNATITSSRNLQDAIQTPNRNHTGEDIVKLDIFIAKHPVKYVWLQFISNTGTLRNRMVPLKQFRKQLVEHKYIGVTSALPLLLQNDYPAAGCIATGEFKIYPDVSSLYVSKGIDSPSATVQTWWMTETGNGTFEHTDRCPRWTLQSQAQKIFDEFDLSILLGFEVEVIFVRPVMNEDRSDYEDFKVVQQVHSWSNMTVMQLDMLPMIENIVEALAEIGIHLEQFHAEAAPTQWEFPLPALAPVQAVDQLYKARETIGNVARKHGFKATVYPRPYTMAPGSASHAHFSINGTTELVNLHEDAFLAGVLRHLPAIMAFSMALEESYERVKPGIWSGGIYVTWGTQNREVPLRKCGAGHWELKAVDGMGNMYFALAALLAAGLDGLRNDLELNEKDTLVDPSTQSDEWRQQMGIKMKLPSSLSLSMESLKADVVLTELLGKGIVDDYLAVKEAEMELLGSMSEQKRRVWLMARY